MTGDEPIVEDASNVRKNPLERLESAWKEQEKRATEAGLGILCPVDGEFCTQDYCQSICADEGCRNLNKCWSGVK